jgi:site-specific recombinase XerD
MSYAERITRPVRTMTDRELAALLRVTGEHRAGFRDHVFYSLAVSTGLREHEMLALNLGDVFDAAGRARRHLALRVFKRSAAEPAPQEVMLSSTVRVKLEKLFRLRRSAGATAEDPLFVSRLGRRLSARQARHAFGKWQERAGLERRFTVHSLRHAACSGVYRRTKDIRLTQRFARHKSIVTTAIYAHPSDEELARVVHELPC